MTTDLGLAEAFMFLEAGTDPAVDRVIVDNGDVHTLSVWAPDGPTAARVAAELVAAGVRLIELYRGFDLASAAQVIEAVDGRAPVGVAGTFEAGRAPGGSPKRSVVIYGHPLANPATDRVAKEHAAGGWTVVVGAPDALVPQVAAELVDDGADLIEISGGTPLATAARVREAVGGRVPVTLVSWPFESIEGAAAFKAAFEARVANGD